MNLADIYLQQLDDPTLDLNEKTLIRCLSAADFIHSGNYESAREVLGELWQGVGNTPKTENLRRDVKAEVLLQCGVLSGWLGSVNQIKDAQDKAKDILTVALNIFQSLKLKVKISETQFELGMCYWRIGAFDEARIMLEEASQGLEDLQLRAKILIRRTLIEISLNRYHKAWDILDEAGTIFEQAGDALKGRWHGQKGLVLVRLAIAENKPDYYDRAIIEFTAAIIHYEKARHERYCAININNLALLLSKRGRYKEAHNHLNSAINILSKLKDDGLLAQVNETRARIFLSEKRYQEGIKSIERSIDVLKRGGENALLADALIIQATLQARLNYYEKSLKTFMQAINIAEVAGALTSAGQSALALIEEHGIRLSRNQIYQTYIRADKFLKGTQDKEDMERLRICARIVLKRIYAPRIGEKNFCLDNVVDEFEAEFIEQALIEADGSVTTAAKKLGIKYQTLAARLKTRHKNLLDKRTPVKKRRRSIIKKKARS